MIGKCPPFFDLPEGGENPEGYQEAQSRHLLGLILRIPTIRSRLPPLIENDNRGSLQNIDRYMQFIRGKKICYISLVSNFFSRSPRANPVHQFCL